MNFKNPPRNPKSHKWKKVISWGCGGYQDSYTLDYDCHHPFEWTCDDCPCCIVAMEAKEKEFLRAFVGPPEPPFF